MVLLARKRLLKARRRLPAVRPAFCPRCGQVRPPRTPLGSPGSGSGSGYCCCSGGSGPGSGRSSGGSARGSGSGSVSGSGGVPFCCIPLEARPPWGQIWIETASDACPALGGIRGPGGFRFDTVGDHCELQFGSPPNFNRGCNGATWQWAGGVVYFGAIWYPGDFDTCTIRGGIFGNLYVGGIPVGNMGAQGVWTVHSDWPLVMTCPGTVQHGSTTPNVCCPEGSPVDMLIYEIL